MHEFEAFEAKKFVSRLLGKADWNGFLERVQVRPPARAPRPGTHAAHATPGGRGTGLLGSPTTTSAHHSHIAAALCDLGQGGGGVRLYGAHSQGSIH